VVNTDQNAGVFSAKSGDIADQQYSELAINIDMNNSGAVSFYKKISSESGAPNSFYDGLYFYIDGIERGKWQGEITWSKQIYNVSSGAHTLKWVYRKDARTSSGMDCAWIDDVLVLTDEDKVLEIGTGSGYQAAVLAEIAQEVYSVEVVEELARRAQDILRGEGYENICFHTGDGTFGWKKHAPYDAIMVTAAPSRIPEKLQEQLKINGRMIVPVGDTFQELVLIIRGKNKFKTKKLLPVRFVPLISAH